MWLKTVCWVGISGKECRRSVIAVNVAAAGERLLPQQANSSGEHGHDALEDEAAGADAVLAARDQRVEGVGDIARGFAGDVDSVVGEEGLEGAREQEIGPESLGFALFVALELGGELGAVAQGLFERGHCGGSRESLVDS
jgi:hypothetical protein